MFLPFSQINTAFWNFSTLKSENLEIRRVFEVLENTSLKFENLKRTYYEHKCFLGPGQVWVKSYASSESSKTSKLWWGVLEVAAWWSPGLAKLFRLIILVAGAYSKKLRSSFLKVEYKGTFLGPLPYFKHTLRFANYYYLIL